MEKYEFNTADLFENFFGFRALPYPLVIAKRFIPNAAKLSEDFDFKNKTIELKESLISHRGSQYYAKNELGNLMFMPIKLKRNTAEWVTLENTVISLTCKKTIVETPLLGRRGTVKEEININDWDISIKGIIVGKRDYPEVEVDKLRELFEEPGALEIENVLTSMFLNGQEKVVIKSLDLMDNKGMEHVQPYSLELVSDTEFDLYIE